MNQIHRSAIHDAIERVNPLVQNTNGYASFIETLITMLRLAISFLIMAMFASFLGFDGTAIYSWTGAIVLFVIFFALTAASYFGSTYFLKNQDKTKG
jgi:uncharacterized membrane protein YtjA (UPF0391 family)